MFNPNDQESRILKKINSFKKPVKTTRKRVVRKESSSAKKLNAQMLEIIDNKKLKSSKKIEMVMQILNGK
ncbi:MAG: hypothetical protein ABF294_10555 [Flavobacteriales bacterium]